MNKFITLSFAMITCFGYAQKAYEKADNLFAKMWYIDAAKVYESSINAGDRSKALFQKAGDAYYFNVDMENAYRWYHGLVTLYPDEVEATYLFRYAHTLKGIGAYNRAKKWMKTYTEKFNPLDHSDNTFSQKQQKLDQIINQPPQFVLKNLSINTPFSDFGAMYYNGELIYASANKSSHYHTRTYHWNNQSFLNLYKGTITSNQWDVIPMGAFSKTINTKYHEATVSFSPDKKTIYFTRNNHNKKLTRDAKGINHLTLYSAMEIKGKHKQTRWGHIKKLPFNSKDYSVGHPAVSKDGKQLYFVSDMPGTIGGTDIFVVDILENDHYSSPRNLGPAINTFGREMFPYITDKALYFSSDGHLGLGSLDVFESKINNNRFATPQNLGKPLNSNLDDFAFIIDEHTNTGFVSSNRKPGKGDDDIYAFKREPLKPCKHLIKGNVKDAITGKSIPHATISLFSENNTEIASVKTNEKGHFFYKHIVFCDNNYTIIAQKSNYKKAEKKVYTSSETGETEVPLVMELQDKFIVEEKNTSKINIRNIHFDFDKSTIRNDAALELDNIVALMRKYPKMVIKIESHTDSRGVDAYNVSLSRRRAKSTKNYLIKKGIAEARIEDAMGYGESRLINNCANDIPCSKAAHESNRRSEFIIVTK